MTITNPERNDAPPTPEEQTVDAFWLWLDTQIKMYYGHLRVVRLQDTARLIQADIDILEKVRDGYVLVPYDAWEERQ